MEYQGLTSTEHAELMERYREAFQKRYGSRELSAEDENRLDAEIEGAWTEYAERLPRVALSRCPYCGETLRCAFDPYGLDGFWWVAMAPVSFREPPACEHFCVLLGALDLRGRPPGEVTDAVEPGPEVPFVVPRLFRFPGMKAVISCFTLVRGDLAYPIAYFAKERLASKDVHQPWGKRSYQVFDEDGVPQGFAVKTDIWDFDLEPWIERGQLHWIDPGDSELRLRGKAEGPCPYLNLPGDRQPQVLENGKRILLSPPDGEDADIFDS